MRYLGEVQWRLTGDRATALRYLSEARKYIAELNNRLDLGGVQTGSWERRHRDGVIFRVVKTFGNTPIGEIDVTPITGVEQRGVIEGFVVRPGDRFNEIPQSVDNFVLLDPVQHWSSYFYQGIDLPASPDWQVGLYRTDSRGQPLFQDGTLHADPGTHVAIPPHMDGMMGWGNVDWRNKDESLIVTWWGPAARYTGGVTRASQYVFYHGQVLFDCTVLTAAGFFGSTAAYDTHYGGRDGVVTGACIVGSFLYAIVRFGALVPVSTDPRKEFLIRQRIRSTDPRSVYDKTGSTATVTGDAEILLAHDLVAHITDLGHPWFFNQSGTEARCIRYDGTNYGTNFATEVVEAILSKDDDGIWHYTQVTHPIAVVTEEIHNAVGLTNNTTSQDVYEYEFTIPTGTCGPLVETAPGAAVLTLIGTAWPAYSLGSSVHSFVDHYSNTDERTVDEDWILAAVDYRDDLVVYAYAAPPSYSDTFEFDVTSLTDGNTYIESHSGAWGSDFTAEETHTVTRGFAATATETRTGITGGIKTDWAEITATQSREFTSTSNHDQTITATRHWEWAFEPLGCDYHAPVQTESGTFDDVANFDVSDVTTIETVSLLYLDLRYKWLVYSKKADVTTVTQSDHGVTLSVPNTSAPGALFGTVLGLEVVLAPTTLLTVTTVVTEQEDFYTTLDGVELAHSTTNDTISTTPATVLWNPACWAFGVSASLTPSSSTTTQNNVPLLAAWENTGQAWTKANDDVGNPMLYRAAAEYGSWQTYKGHWIFSQPLPDGDPTVPAFLFKASTDPDIKHRVNQDGADNIVRMHPIWVLPKVTY